MNKLIKNKAIYKHINIALLLTTCAIIFSILFHKSELRTADDDMFFYHALDTKNLITFLHSRYMGWSGRLSLEAIMVSTIKYKYFWKLAIPSCFLLLCYSINKIVFKKIAATSIGVTTIAIISLKLINENIALDACWWITGFYNYLLPISCGMFSTMVLYKQEEYSNIYLLLSMLGLFIACYNEQVAISIIISSLIILAARYRNKKPLKFSVLFIFIVTINSIIIFAAPGNYIRFIQETTTWLPEFSSYSLLHKITLGIDRINAHLHDHDFKIFQIACLLLLLLITKERKPWKTKPIATSILSFSVVSPLLHLHHLPSWLALFSFATFLSPENWSSCNIYISYSLSLTAISSILTSNIYIAKNQSELIQLILYPSLGFLSIMLLSLSPTVYASGFRVLFLCDIFFVMYTCLLLEKCFCEICLSSNKVNDFVKRN